MTSSAAQPPRFLAQSEQNLPLYPWRFRARFPLPRDASDKAIDACMAELGCLTPAHMMRLGRRESPADGAHVVVAMTQLVVSATVKGRLSAEAPCDLTSSTFLVDGKPIDSDRVLLTVGRHTITAMTRTAGDAPALQRVSLSVDGGQACLLDERESGPEPIDLSRLGRLVDPIEAAISPDGRYGALVCSNMDERRDEFVRSLWLLNFPTDGSIGVHASMEQSNARLPRFSPDGRRIAFVRTSLDGGSELAIYTLCDGRLEIAHRVPGDIPSFVWARDSNGLICICEEAPEATTARVIESMSGRLPWWQPTRRVDHVRLLPGSPLAAVTLPVCESLTEADHLCLSPDGRVLAFVESTCENGRDMGVRLHRVNLSSLEREEPLRLPTTLVGCPVFSPDGRRIAYVGGRVKTAGGSGLLEEAGAQGGVSAERALNGYDMRVHIVDLVSKTMTQLDTDAPFAAGIPVGIAPIHQEIFWRDDEHLWYVATKGGQTGLVRQTLPGVSPPSWESLGSGSSRGHSFANDGTCFFLHSELGDPFAPVRWTPAGSLVTSAAISGLAVTLESRRARPIDDLACRSAWLYLPERSLTAGPIPLVVCVYGGATPLCMAFDECHQALTARGYAVLVVNPSGCSGCGPAVADMHVNDWGAVVVPEIVQSVETILARYPMIDRHAVGVYGGSYGGFLVMRLLAESRLFAAGCSIAGISNIASYWGGSRFGFQYGQSALAQSYPWSHRHIFVDRSPLFMAPKICAPLLLLHGECDSIVPIGESEQMFVALKALERDVCMVVFSDEDHGIRSRPSVKVAFRSHLLSWFDKTLRRSADAWTDLAQAHARTSPPVSAPTS